MSSLTTHSTSDEAEQQQKKAESAPQPEDARPVVRAGVDPPSTHSSHSLRPQPLLPAAGGADNDWGRQYARRGYAFPIVVLSKVETAVVLAQLGQYERAFVGEATASPSPSQPTAQQPMRGDGRFKIHLLVKWAWELVHHRIILDAVRSCLRCNDIWCWSSDLNVKESQTPTHFTWHQDSTYAGFHPPDDALTVWLALTPSTIESGCLHCIPQATSQRRQLPHATGRGGDSNGLSHGQEVANWPSDVDPDAAEALVLQPGQASIHSFLTVHASHPNQSKSVNRRVGFAIRYVSAHGRKLSQSVDGRVAIRESATLVSGDWRGLFDPEHPPLVDLGPAERRAHASALELERRNYLPSGQQYR